MKKTQIKSHPTLGGERCHPGCTCSWFSLSLCGLCSSTWCQGSLLQARGEQCDSQALTVGLFLLQCTDADGPAVDRARAWCEMTDVPYFR